MKYSEVLDIIKTGEGYTIEFKETVNSSIGKDICAFANSSGGKITIGVNDRISKVNGYKLTNSEANRTQIGHKSDKQVREKWILDYLKENKVIKTVDVMNQFSVVKDTAARDLKSLIKQNKIVRKGGGNNVWYVLKNKESKNDN